MANTVIYNGGLGTSSVIPINGIADLACQLVVRGSGAVSATVSWYVNVDGTTDEWVLLGTTTASGTDVASDGFAAPLTPWQFLRATVSAISGTAAYTLLKIGW